MDDTARVFVVQVEPVATGVSPQAVSTVFTKIGTDQLENVRDLIDQVSHYVASKIKRDELSPQELTVEFGIGLKGDATIPFLAKAGVEANFKVTAKWLWSVAK